MPASAWNITVEDTDSEIRGKVLNHLISLGIDRLRFPKVVAAKKSQSYVDLKAAYKSEARRARQAKAFDRPGDGEEAA